MMSHNAKANEKPNSNDAPADRRPDQARACHNCGKPGHYAKTCKSPKKRSDRSAGLVEKSARDAVAEADGLKIALAEKQKELTDLKADKAKAEAEATEIERSERERLKAQMAQDCMSDEISLGSSILSLCLRVLLLVWVLSVTYVGKQVRLLIRILILPWLAAKVSWNVMTLKNDQGYRVKPLYTKLVVFIGWSSAAALLNTFKCAVFHNLPITMAVWTACSFLVAAYQLIKGSYEVRALWMGLSTMKTCPSEVWTRRRHLVTVIGPADTRDDTAATVELGHHYDHVVYYDIAKPSRIFRIVWFLTQFGCTFSKWIFGYPVVLRFTDLMSYNMMSTLCSQITLGVSSSLARQVKVARNSPMSMSPEDVRALLERASAHEGKTNVTSYMMHDTLGELRANTARYVMATQVSYREQLALAGF
jgi:hypothetical protein